MSSSIGYLSAGRLLPLSTFRANTAAAVEYIGLHANLTSPTEADCQTTLDYDAVVRRFRCKPIVNSKTGNATISFRDDGADVTGTLQTIAAGAKAEKDSGPISSVIRADSLIDFKLDATAAGGAALSISCLVILEVLT